MYIDEVLGFFIYAILMGLGFFIGSMLTLAATYFIMMKTKMLKKVSKRVMKISIKLTKNFTKEFMKEIETETTE